MLVLHAMTGVFVPPIPNTVGVIGVSVMMAGPGRIAYTVSWFKLTLISLVPF